MSPNANASPAVEPDVLSDEFGFRPEDVVITGFSGRLPESDSIDEVTKNLYAGMDMVNENPTRWPTGSPRLRLERPPLPPTPPLPRLRPRDRHSISTGGGGIATSYNITTSSIHFTYFRGVRSNPGKPDWMRARSLLEIDKRWTRTFPLQVVGALYSNLSLSSGERFTYSRFNGVSKMSRKGLHDKPIFLNATYLCLYMNSIIW